MAETSRMPKIGDIINIGADNYFFVIGMIREGKYTIQNMSTGEKLIWNTGGMYHKIVSDYV